jgi:hypothetical protein
MNEKKIVYKPFDAEDYLDNDGQCGISFGSCRRPKPGGIRRRARRHLVPGQTSRSLGN